MLKYGADKPDFSGVQKLLPIHCTASTVILFR